MCANLKCKMNSSRQASLTRLTVASPTGCAWCPRIIGAAPEVGAATENPGSHARLPQLVVWRWWNQERRLPKHTAPAVHPGLVPAQTPARLDQLAFQPVPIPICVWRVGVQHQFR